LKRWKNLDRWVTARNGSLVTPKKLQKTNCSVLTTPVPRVQRAHGKEDKKLSEDLKSDGENVAVQK
jgi:hypothetical protein